MTVTGKIQKYKMREMAVEELKLQLQPASRQPEAGVALNRKTCLPKRSRQHA